MPGHEIPNHIEEQWEKWHWQTNLLRACRILFYLIGTGCVAVIVAFADKLDARILSILSLSAGMAVGAVSAFGWARKANRMRRAWRMVSAARLRYLTGVRDIEYLIDVYERAESIIGDVNFDSEFEDPPVGEGDGPEADPEGAAGEKLD